MNRLRPILLSFLVVAPTLVFVPQVFAYLTIAAIGLINWAYLIRIKGVRRDDVFHIIFLCISFLVYFVGSRYAMEAFSKSLNDFVPYSLFIVATIYFAKLLRPSIIKWICYFILLESILGIIQYIIGVPYFFKPSSIGMQEFGESEYLYYNKVYGLSAVTSVFALKIFIGFILVYYLNFRKKVRVIAYLILAAGLIATFNRTAMVSSTVFGLLVMFANFRQKGHTTTKVLLLLSAIILSAIVYLNFDIIELQFFRGKEMDLSGRDHVFPYYIQFIEDHPFWGNFFTKHWAELKPGRIYHAHNSYLQTFANMGLVFGGLLLLYMISKINKNNYIFVLPILLYSGFQYGILWGVSLMDIVFFYFLFNKMGSPQNRVNENSVNSPIL